MMNASREYISTQNAKKPQCLISFSIQKYGKICGQRFIKLQVFLYNRRPAKRAATVLKVKSKITIKGKPTTPQRSASQAQTAGQFHLAKGFYSMHRAFTFSITTALLLFACSLFSPKETPPSETIIAPTTSMPATQPPTSMSVTQPSVEQPNLQTGWLDQLETISSQNWTQLQLLQTFPAEMPMVHSVVVIEPDGKTLVLGNSNKAQLFFFDLESGTISPKSLYIHDVENVDVPFKAIKYLSDGSIIVSSDSPYMIYHIDSAGNILSAWDGIEFAVSADEKNLALEVDEGTSVINIANNAPIALLENSNGLGFSFSPDNSKIAIDAVTVDYANVDIWDIKSQTILKTLLNMYKASYSPNGNFLAALDNVEGSLKIFSPDGAIQITTIRDIHSDYLISPDGSIVAYQTAEGSSVARDTTNWAPIETALRGRLDSFSPDGRFLITRTDDGGILIWGILKANG